MKKSNPFSKSKPMRSDYVNNKKVPSPLVRVPEEDFDNVIVVKRVDEDTEESNRRHRCSWNCPGGCLLCDR